MRAAFSSQRSEGKNKPQGKPEAIEELEQTASYQMLSARSALSASGRFPDRDVRGYGDRSWLW